MSGNQSMEKQYSVQFFSNFVSTLQKLCQAYVKYDRNIEVSGYLCVEVDNSKKERFVLSELIQNCGSVVSESYCTKVFRTLPPAPTSTAGINSKQALSSDSADRSRQKTVERRNSNSNYRQEKSNDSFSRTENGSSFGLDYNENARVPQKSRRLSLDQSKENVARLSRDIANRLSGESQYRSESESNKTWPQLPRQNSLPSFSQISRGRSLSASSSSQRSALETADLRIVKIENSMTEHLPCAHANTATSSTSEDSSSTKADSQGGPVPVSIHTNYSSFGNILDAYTAQRTTGSQSLVSPNRFSSSNAPSSSQAAQSSSSQLYLQQSMSWAASDIRSTSQNQGQHDVFMQMLPQGYGKQSVQTVHSKEGGSCFGTPGDLDTDDVIDLDIEDMDAENSSNSVADINASLTFPGMDQTTLSEYMMSSSQVSDTQRKRNAQLNCQRYALRLFCEFHQNHSGSMPSLGSLTTDQMDAMLGEFYATSKKGNGEDFTVSSLRSIQYYLESHLFENYILTGSRATLFKNSRQALRKRCEDLRSKQKTAPASKRTLISTDIDTLFEKGQLGAESPDVLLNTLWFMNVICFGIKGSEHFSLRWGDIILNTDKSGRQYLEYSGQGSSGHFAHHLRVYALPHNKSRCCVYYFKQYLSHRSPVALQPDDPFYLAINGQYKRVGSWFVKEKVSMSRLTSAWKNMLFYAGLPPDKKLCVGHQTGLMIQDAASTSVATPDTNLVDPKVEALGDEQT